MSQVAASFCIWAFVGKKIQGLQILVQICGEYLVYFQDKYY